MENGRVPGSIVIMIHRVLPPVLRAILLALAVPLVPAPGLRAGESKEEAGEFLRFIPGQDSGRLESAVAVFEGPKGKRVSLIAAIHVADKTYYQDLSRLFEGYDALLYELVKPAGAVPRRGGASPGMIGALQRGLRDLLGLEFQLDWIDYTRPNFVHADMDAATFEKMQRERGENLFTLILRQIAADLNRGGRAAEEDIDPFQLLAALLSRDRARSMKLLLGKQFGALEARAAGLDGPGGSVILSERNKVAIDVLKKALESGKKDIGIFYGAAHMPDMEKRLGELGFARKDTRWLVAWDVPEKGKAVRKPAGRLRRI
jgi:hypothetical protein